MHKELGCDCHDCYTRFGNADLFLNLPEVEFDHVMAYYPDQYVSTLKVGILEPRMMRSLISSRVRTGFTGDFQIRPQRPKLSKRHFIHQILFLHLTLKKFV